MQCRKDDGYLIIYSMILTFVLMAIGLSTLSVVSAKYNHSRGNINRQNVAYAARACVSIAMNQLKDDPAYTGNDTGDLITVFDRIASGGGKAGCTIEVTNGAGNTKVIKVDSQLHRTDMDPHPVLYESQAIIAPVEGGGYRVVDYRRQ